MMLDPLKLATSTESSLQQLRSVTEFYPTQVLDTLEIVGPLLSIEDPVEHHSLLESAALWEVKNTVAASSMLHLRQEAIEAVRKALVLFSNWQPREGIKETFTPLYAIEVAELHCAGKVTRKSLAWASRYCSTFLDHHDNSEYANNTDRLAQLCQGTCALTRDGLWKAARSSVRYYLPLADARDDSKVFAEQRRLLRSLRERKGKAKR